MASKKHTPNPLIDHSLDQSAHYPANGETLSDSAKSQIDDHLSKYPEDQRISAVMPALTIAQQQNGGLLTEALIGEVAAYIGIPSIAAQEVATFYSMYGNESPAQYKISFCHNISCMLCGGDELLKHIQNKLGIKPGEVTPDGKFLLKKVECLGACVGAPMMLIGDEYYEHLTPEKVDTILDNL